MRNKPDKLLSKAVSLMEQGQGREAKKLFNKLLRTQPDHLDGNYLLGTLCAEDGELLRGRQLLLKALKIKPDSPYIHNNLGNIYMQQKKYQDALNCYQRAQEIKPDMPQAYCNIGEVCLLNGDLERARKNFELAEKLQPGLDQARAGLASVHEHTGNYRKARKSMHKAISAGARDVYTVMAYAEAILHDKPSPAELEKALQLVGELVSPDNKAAVSKVEQPKVYYLLGALNDQLKNYQQAFDCYATANKKSASRYSIDKLNATVSTIRENFTPETLPTHSHSNGAELIFIIGMPRSGSTLLEQILDSHPQVASLGEGDYFSRALDAVRGDSSPAPLTQEQADKVARQYRDYCREQHPQASVVSDKTLSNYLHAGQILQAFPRAKIIHCTRNPLDTCMSCYFHNFAGELEFTNDLVTLGQYFRAYQGLMEHWQTVLGDRLYEAAYEKLIDAPKDEIWQLLDYCGLPFKRSCLKFHKNKRVVNTASYFQVRKPIYRTAVNRSEPYLQYLEPLRSELDGNS